MAKKRDVEVIEVTVVRTGTSFNKKVTLNGDRSILAALRAAGVAKKEAEDVLVNNKSVDDLRNYSLDDGDRIALIKNIEGGSF